MRRVIGVLVTASVIATAALAIGQSGVAQATARTPVVFVHGFTGNASSWDTVVTAFTTAGYSSDELFAYEYDSYGDNIENAKGLAIFVKKVRSQTGSSTVDIVNHSMGGMVSLWYLKQLGGASSVKHLASLAGANHGTIYAAACLIFTTCQQMYPGSSFLTTLATGDETPGSVKYATWYSPCDGVIIPYTSTALNGATNDYVACESHLTYLTNTVIHSAVHNFLDT